MMVRDASSEDIARVCLAMRESDRIEIAASTFCETREEMAVSLSRAYGAMDGVWCCLWDEVPAVIAFSIVLRPRTLSIGMFATDDWSRVSQHWIRWARKTLAERVEHTRAHRIEVASMTPPGTTDSWFHWFGLEPESAMQNFGKHGETFWLYSRVSNSGESVACSAA